MIDKVGVVYKTFMAFFDKVRAYSSTQERNPDLAQRAILTSVSGLLQQAAQLSVKFLVTPILIQGLGTELYGAWLMIQQIAGYVSLSDLRPMGTLKFTLAVQQHVEDLDQKRRQVGAAIKLWLLTLPMFLVISVLVVWAIPRFVSVKPENVQALQLSAALIVFSIPLTRVLSLPANILRGINLDYAGMGLNALTILIGGSMTALVIWWDMGLIGIAVASVLGSFVNASARFWIARENVEWLSVEWPSRTEFSSFFKRSSWLFLSGLSSLLLKSSDSLLIGIILSPSVAATYYVTGTALRLATMVIQKLLSSANPGIAGLCGEKDWERVKQARSQIHLLVSITMVVIGAGTIALNEPFLGLWIGEGVYAGDVTNFLLLLLTTQALFFQVDSVIVEFMLELRVKAVCTLVGALLGLFVGLILADKWGLPGMVLGTFLGRLGMTIYFPIVIWRKVGPSPEGYSYSLARIALVSSFLLPTVYGLSMSLHPKTWFSFLVMTMIIGVMSAGMTWYLGLAKGYRERFTRRWRRLLHSLPIGLARD